MEVTRKRQEITTREPDTGIEPTSIDIGEAPIPYGQRNNTLTRIAGKLHDGSRNLAQLTAELEDINRTLCSPPIGDHPTDRDPNEVRKIAASIYRGEPCMQGSTSPSEQTLEELGRIEETHLWRREWKGAGWKVPRSVFVALIKTARLHGTLIPAGVRVSISTRALALAAACSHPPRP